VTERLPPPSWASQIDLALGHVSGVNAATIQVARDNGGIPETVLGTWSVSGRRTLGSCCGPTGAFDVVGCGKICKVSP
jgi:hypothetical protein